MRSGSAALAGEPGLAELAALLLRRRAPNARLLIGRKGELEARALHLTRPADPFGRFDLLEGQAGRPNREEEVGVGIAAGRL